MIRLSDIRKTVCTSTAATFIALFCYMPQAYADNTDNFTVSPTDTISPAGTADNQAAQMLGIIPETEGTNQRQKSGPKSSPYIFKAQRLQDGRRRVLRFPAGGLPDRA